MQTVSTHWSLVSVLNAVAIRHNTHCTYNVNSEPPCLIATRTIDKKLRSAANVDQLPKLKRHLGRRFPGVASNFIVLNGSTEPCVSNLGFHVSVLVC